jgi:hypothetical protein
MQEYESEKAIILFICIIERSACFALRHYSLE